MPIASPVKRQTGSGSGIQSDAPGVGEALKRVADGVSSLVKEHLALARAELRQDLRAAGRDAALAAAGVPLALVGWALLMIALSVALAPVVGYAGGFALVGGLNLVAGALVSAIFLRRLATTSRPDLEHTTRQIQEDRRWLRNLRQSHSAPGPHRLPVPREPAATSTRT